MLIIRLVIFVKKDSVGGYQPGYSQVSSSFSLHISQIFHFLPCYL